MAATYVNITSTTLGSDTSPVTFSSIPSTYTDLVLRISGRNTGSGAFGNVRIQFNGDTASNYSYVYMQGSGSAASAGRNSSVTQIQVNNGVDIGTDTANTFANIELYIPSYTVSQHKPFYWFGATENNASTAYINSYANLWRNTAAISSISLFFNSFAFATGSTFYLYGIKNS
jgi:hypothetical protein